MFPSPTAKPIHVNRYWTLLSHLGLSSTPESVVLPIFSWQKAEVQFYYRDAVLPILTYVKFSSIYFKLVKISPPDFTSVSVRINTVLSGLVQVTSSAPLLASILLPLVGCPSVSYHVQLCVRDTDLFGFYMENRPPGRSWGIAQEDLLVNHPACKKWECAMLWKSDNLVM